MGKNGIQANELALKIGVEPGAVGNWMNGANLAKGRNLRKLAAALNRTPEYFLGTAYPPHTTHPADVNDVGPEESVRRKAHGHLDRVLDACEHDQEKLVWTYVELKNQFPVEVCPAEELAEKVVAKARATDAEVCEMKMGAKAMTGGENHG